MLLAAFSALALCLPAFAGAGLLTVDGTVDDVFPDELDPSALFLLLKTDAKRYYCTLQTNVFRSLDAESLIGADVRVTGSLLARRDGPRRHMDRVLDIAAQDGLIVLSRPKVDPFEAPPLEDLKDLQSDAIALSGRRRVEGYVKAAWGKNTIFLTTADGNSCLVYLQNSRGMSCPDEGDFIRAVGLPETDLFSLNLTRSFWKRVTPTFPAPQDLPIDVDCASLAYSHHQANPGFQTDYSGKTVRLKGRVISLQDDTLTLRCGKSEFALFAANGQKPFADVLPGCAIEAVCVAALRTGVWTYSDPIPRIKGYHFIVRKAADVTVLSRPPWWTPERLLAAIAILVLALVAIFIWNRVLQHAIHRKSRQLLREQVAQIRSALRVDERTHLAVELHDTLSQNLSGVACQIAATKGTLPDHAEEAERYLATAERMLLSCRTELRRCLWDLRGDTLETPDFAEAIRRTLAPVTPGAEVSVRFNVPRSRLSDTTAHGVLCIVRELVSNAIRHGKARVIRVAGEFHDGSLSFSVRDDGGGFDVSRCAGPAEGHFGLEGIRERVTRLDGAFSISSTPGKGTRAEVVIKAVQPREVEEP